MDFGDRGCALRADHVLDWPGSGSVGHKKTGNDYGRQEKREATGDWPHGASRQGDVTLFVRIGYRKRKGNNMKARGEAKKDIEAVGGDPNVDDTEGKASEDTWFGRGSHGWFDRLLKRRGAK
jgi:hypothetical protein